MSFQDRKSLQRNLIGEDGYRLIRAGRVSRGIAHGDREDGALAYILYSGSMRGT